MSLGLAQGIRPDHHSGRLFDGVPPLSRSAIESRRTEAHSSGRLTISVATSFSLVVVCGTWSVSSGARAKADARNGLQPWRHELSNRVEDDLELCVVLPLQGVQLAGEIAVR